MGGMAATRASGTNSVRYGTMAGNVKAARWIMADGSVAAIGSRAPKSAMGLDLLAIAIGSEGTLGIFSELQVRLHPVPEAIVAGVCSFDSVDNAVQTVASALGQGLSIARIELLDATAVRACNAYSAALGLVETPHLFLEFTATGRRSPAVSSCSRIAPVSTAGRSGSPSALKNARPCGKPDMTPGGPFTLSTKAARGWPPMSVSRCPV
jgi:FAD/FMN-containing dehydrogenase